METAKLFTDGYRQTVLLPQTYRFYGNEVYIKEVPGVYIAFNKNIVRSAKIAFLHRLLRERAKMKFQHSGGEEPFI